MLLGHAVVAPRGPPVRGCLHSGELVGNSRFAGNESRCIAPRVSGPGSTKLRSPSLRNTWEHLTSETQVSNLQWTGDQ